MSLRSPLGRVLGLGSAKKGSGHWYAQRTTAVALVILGIWFVASLALLGRQGASHASVVHWLSSPFSAAMALLLVVVGAYHALLGLQVVIEDYVGDQGTRAVVIVAVKFALVVAALIGVLAVLRLAFGVHA
jgi:succinate dehydrogenase / fumarate reductase membrane anchor subunit